jgi:hypothetical protein
VQRSGATASRVVVPAFCDTRGFAPLRAPTESPRSGLVSEDVASPCARWRGFFLAATSDGGNTNDPAPRGYARGGRFRRPPRGMMYWAKIATTMIAAAMAKIAVLETATITASDHMPRSPAQSLRRERHDSRPSECLRERVRARLSAAGAVRNNAGRRLVRRVDTGLPASTG